MKNNELWEELLHYVLDEFLRKPNLQQILDSGKAKFYFVRMLTNQANSSTSPFYNLYRMPSADITDDMVYDDADMDKILADDIEFSEKYDTVCDTIAQMHWYHQMMFNTLVDEDLTVTDLSNQTGIPRTSVSLIINNVRREVKAKLDANKNQKTNP